MEDHYGRSVKMVPRLLNEERRVQVCQDILEQLKTEPNLLNRVVTGDESWIFEYDPLTKRQSLEWKSALSPRPKKARMFKFKTKVMLIVCFDFNFNLLICLSLTKHNNSNTDI